MVQIPTTRFAKAKKRGHHGLNGTPGGIIFGSFGGQGIFSWWAGRTLNAARHLGNWNTCRYIVQLELAEADTVENGVTGVLKAPQV